MEFLYKGTALPHGQFLLHSRFESVVNFLAEDRLVSLVEKKVGGGPRRLVVSGLTKLPRNENLVLTIDAFSNTVKLSIEDQVLYTCSLENLPPKHFKLPSRDLSSLRAKLSSFEDFFVSKAPKKSLFYLIDSQREQEFETSFEKALVQSFKDAYSPLGKSSLNDVLRAFKGKGLGLTPSGDDFNLGLLTALSLQGSSYAEYFKMARGESLFVNSFLAELEEGWVNEKTYLWLQSFEEDEESLKKATLNLYDQGETSGADWLVGFISGFNLGRLYAN